jgi:hypothetical protein
MRWKPALQIVTLASSRHRSKAGRMPALRPLAGKMPALRPLAGKMPALRPLAGRMPALRPLAGKMPALRPLAGRMPALRPLAGKMPALRLSAPSRHPGKADGMLTLPSCPSATITLHFGTADIFPIGKWKAQPTP